MWKRYIIHQMLNQGLSRTNLSVNLSANFITLGRYCVQWRKWIACSSLISGVRCNQVTLLLFGCFNNRNIQMWWLDLGSSILITQLLCICNHVRFGGCFFRWVTNSCFQELTTFFITLGHAVGRDAFLDHDIIVPLSQLVSQSDNCQTSIISYLHNLTFKVPKSNLSWIVYIIVWMRQGIASECLSPWLTRGWPLN